MPREAPITVSGAVEGLVDEAVLRRLVAEAGALLGSTYGKSGRSHLQQRMTGYNHAARFSRWVVLVDLDRDPCAPSLRASWLTDPAPWLCFRVAVREVETWLLADRDGLASFLGVPSTQLPPDPETEPDPKLTLVNIASRSRRRDIRQGMVPRQGSGRVVGPAYTAQLIEFIQTRWRPDLAGPRSDSLRRCRERIDQLVNASL